ncbi:hypothetical protein NM208_g3386 [Fusarium decemcellulare]|uniref:Uncharacterized protein n=1 Tax=Fusarium decemcellulare TaxID=57161 RepID=A0ACC1SPC4_9HYPO|nr:hypothetical protein NM208_g3386 [Fusarium decemcellulare]
MHRVQGPQVLQDALDGRMSKLPGIRTTVQPVASDSSNSGWSEDLQQHVAQVGYWRQVLEDLQCTSFPSMPPSIQQQPPAPSMASDNVGPSQQRLLLPPLKQQSASTNTLLRAAWALVAAKMTNSESVAFGINTSSETTAPLYARCHSDQSVLSFIKAVQGKEVDLASSSSQIPLSVSVMEQLPSLFQTLLLTPAQDSAEDIPVLSRIGSGLLERCGLSLVLEVESAGNDKPFAVLAHYNASVLPTTDVRKLLDRFASVVLHLDNAQPDQHMTDIEVMAYEDLEDIWSWNAQVPATVDGFIHEAIQDRALKHPSSTAVCAWDGEFTYAELDHFSDRLAMYLISSLGVQSSTPIALCFEKSRWTPVAMLGVLKAGAYFIMLDPTSAPEQRLQTMSLSSRLCRRTVILDIESLERFPRKGEGSANILLHQSQSTSPSTTLAHVIFTSGSTGTPKAIPTTHQSVRSALHHQVAAINVTSTSRLYDFASYSFDAAIFNTWTVLYAGGCLCIPSEADRKGNLAGSIRELRSNYLTLTPSAAQVLTADPEQIPGVETIMLVGEPLSLQDVTPWWGRVRVINAYGPCECTPLSTANLNPSSPVEVLDIGKGLGQVTWVVDPDNHNRLVPPGCIGELVLEGPLVSKGYLNDAERTASSFADDPNWLLKSGRHGRVYKTGDLVRYCSQDGRLRYVGRKDAQVKIRGQRVELGEVEHQLQQCIPEASQVVAEMILPKGAENSSSAMLAAFLAIPSPATNGINGSEYHADRQTPEIFVVSKEVQAALSRALPSFMVPNVFFLLRELPKAAGSGKLDRKKLRQIGSNFSVKQLAALRTSSRGPKRQPNSGSVAYVMQGIWANLLKMDRSDIGMDDSFFQVGGDSIVAMKVVRDARDQLGVQLSVADILQYPLLSDTAVAVTHRLNSITVDKIYDDVPAPFSLLSGDDNQKEIVHALHSHGIDPSSVEDAYPCTPLQAGLVFLCLKQPGDYIMQANMDLSKSRYPDVNKFRRAWMTVVRDHPLLRTRFVYNNSDAGLAQVVLGHETFSWIEVKDSSLKQYLEKDRKQAMGLGESFARFALVHDAKGAGPWFVWTIHHALYDGWSMQLLMEALDRAYHSSEESSTLVTTIEKRGTQHAKVSYAAFIKYVTDQAMADDDRMANYWKQTLADCEAVPFPKLPIHAQNQTETSDDAEMATLFQELPKMATSSRGFNHATLSTLIRAAWALVVRCMTNSDDVVFGVTVSGRSVPVVAIDEIAGPAMATVPFRVKMAGDMLVEDYLNSVRQRAIDMIPFEQMGLPGIAKLSDDCEHACRFQTLLVIQPKETSNTLEGFDHEDGGPERWFKNTYALLLEAQLGEHGDSSSVLKARFDPSVIRPSTVKSLLERLIFVIAQLNGADGKAETVRDVSNVDVVSPNDLQQLWQWNGTLPATIDRNVHDIILERALTQPDEPAVHAWDGEFTYRELTRLSSILARALIEDHGVSPGDSVALCFEKSKWTTVAILAVLQAGAGIAMLDSFLPEKRLQTIVHEVGARLVVSSELLRDLSLRLECDQVLSLSPELFDRPGDNTFVNVETSPLSPVYAIFSSGSTGTPKGTQISHRSIASTLAHQSKACGFTQTTRAYDFSSYGFDAPIFVALQTLAAGGCLCVPTDEDRKSRLVESLRTLKANWVVLPPSTAQLLAPELVPDLKTLMWAGEAMTAKNLEAWWGSDVWLLNGYGPCECTAAATINRSHAATMTVPKALGLGKGVGQTTWVVDPNDHNRLVPPGAIGELVLEGPCVGQGYFNNEEKNKEMYIQDPTWLLQGALEAGSQLGRHGRLYKTGDLVQYTDEGDGSLSFVGRKADDTQVKIRGQRAELGEIEVRLQQAFKDVSGVEEAVVETIMPSGQGSRPMLAAFLLVNDDSQAYDANHDQEAITPPELYHAPSSVDESLAQSLPGYMIPEVFFKVSHLPTTTTGKLHRTKLRKMGASFTLRQLAGLRTEARKGHKRQPSTRLESELQMIWARVLGFEAREVGLDDSFFRLGGDSIAAMKSVGEATKAGIKISVADIFQHRTIRRVSVDSSFCSVLSSESLAEFFAPFSLLPKDGISLNSVVKGIAAQLDIDESKIQDAYPCTPLQEGLISLASKRVGDYVMQKTLSLSPDSANNLGRFKDAWQKVVNSVPVLRTRIIQNDEFGFLQVLLQEETDEIQWIEATDLHEYLQADRQRPMNLDVPLSRYALIKDETQTTKWFVWTVHHAIYDGLSLPMILGEVAQAFQGVPLEQTRPQVQSFINYIQNQDTESLKTYWKRTLEDDSEGCVSYPSIPSGVQQPIVASDVVEYSIPRDWELFFHNNDITVSTMLRAAWGLITSQMTGSDDIVFGVTISGRNAPVVGIESLAFPTIATVPLRLRLDPKNQSVVDYLDHVQWQATEMIPFEQAGLQRISQMLSPGAQQACSFQTLLIVQPQSSKDSLNEMYQLGQWQNHDQVEWFGTYPLNLEATVASDHVKIDARFDSRIIEPWVVKNLMERLDFAMQQLGRAGPEAMVSDISIMTAGDLKQIWAWNSKVPDTVDRCIHNVIGEQARIRPEAIAVHACDGQLTYAELDKLASELASYLIDLRGEDKNLEERFVPLCFDKSLWTPVAMLGVLKSGAAFVLLDPSLPEQRLKHIIDKVGGGDLILASDSWTTLCGRLSNKVMSLNWDLFAQATPARTSCLPHVPPGSAAYTLFTSGSTGTPKGVVITHRNLSSALPCHVKGLGYTPDSRVYDFASYSFGASLNNMFAALTSGACLCIPSDHDRRSQLDRSLVSMGATHVLLTPSVAESLSPKNVTGLQSIIFGGEAVRPQDVLPWWETGVKVRTAYGSSECTTISTINNTASIPQEVTRIGKGVGLVPWVVHPADHDRLLPPGCVGELLLEGPAIGREYLSDLEKTAEAFIQDPVWLLQGEKKANQDGDNLQPGRSGRLYKTGDLVYYNQDGSLSFVGRKDSQVKIRGQRVELGEVEYWVKEYFPEATQVVVEAIVPMGSDSSHQTLAAFLTMKDTHKQEQVDSDDNKPTIFPISAQVEEMLSRHLPSYMVPTVFFSLPNLPMTVTGKMDRRVIRQMAGSFSAQQLAKVRQGRELQGSSEHDQPTTSTQREMRRIWAKLLDLPIDTIGLDDGFFSLGGDSIASMKVVREARKSGIEVTVSDIFTYRTLREISDHSKDIATNDATNENASNEILPFSLVDNGVDVEALCQNISAQCEIDAAKIQDAYSCTPLQEGLMTAASKRPGDYVMQSVLELSPNVSIDRFQQAWEQAVEAIPVLRTRIVHCDGFEKVGLLQVVLDDKIVWTEGAHLDLFLQVDRERSMVLNEPLSRYALVSEDGSSRPRWFVWTVSHTIYDGWSLPLIFDAVEKAYQAKTAGNPKLPNKAPGFQHFIKYLDEQHKSRNGRKKTEEYWRGYFESSEATLFPSLPSPTYQPVSNQMIQSQMALKSQSSLNMAPSTLIQAAWALVVGQMTNSSDVVFGITVSGRNAPVPNIEAIPGPTIATVPQRITWDADQTVSDYLEKVRHDSTATIPYEHTGLHHIAKTSPNAQQACQFQTLLVIQSQTHSAKGSYNTDQSNISPFPFGKWKQQDQTEWFGSHALIIQPHLGAYNNNDWAVDVSFDPSVIEEWLVRKLIRRLELVMRSFLAERPPQEDFSKKTIHELTSSIMTEDDLEQLWTWNQSVPPAVDECVHRLVEKRALEEPCALAIDAWDGSLTYRELDLLADRVAAKLVGLFGVGCGAQNSKLIPLCFEKSMWTGVAMLGVLKAGGAFVLLDPSLPEQRLKTIVNQARADLVVSSVSNAKLASRLCPRIVEIGPNLFTDTAASHSLATASLKQQRSSSLSPLYSIFTSGSTGTPKGVVISHSNFTSEAKYQSKILGLSKTSRFFDFSSYAFDASIQTILGSFVNGGCVCVPSEQDRKDNLGGIIASMRASVVFLTPTVARLLNPASLPTLETIILGGEAVSVDDAAKWLGGKVRFVNGYGPSECTIGSTFNASPSSPEDATSIGFGAGLVTWIVDPDNHNRLLPPGCTGELLLEGPLVGQGYLNDPAKTAAAFIVDPVWLLQGSSTRPGRRGRMYKSGDLVQYRRDGSLRYMGRKDAQVKIRGQRIELEEVSRQIQASWPGGGCQIAAEVINPRGEGSRPMLAAFIVLNGENNGHEETTLPDHYSPEQAAKPIPISPELEATLADRLPAAMIPSAFFYYMGRQLPQTPTGKTNRKILREIGSSFSVQELAEVSSSLQSSDHDTKDKRQPTMPVEREMQAIWARILGIEPSQVGMDDSFLRLGGDSISAMKVSGEVRKKLHLQVSVADLLRQPKLCDIIATATSSSGGTNGKSFGHADHEEAIPHTEYLGPVVQSYAQSRLWFMDRLYPGLNWYFIPFTARIRGPLQVRALSIALQALERRHEPLRTTFLSRDDVDMQVIKPFVPNETNIFELPRGNRGEDCLQRALEVQHTTPLDLSVEPGWKVTLYRLGSEDDQHYVLSILMHHIISDGWSMNILRREIAGFYTSAVKGLDPLSQISPLPVQYRDYALWQKQSIRQDRYQKQLDYWTSQLQTSRPAEFFCDKPRPNTLSGEAGVVEFLIEGSLYNKVQRFCQDNRVTPFVALLAAFRGTHYRLTGAVDATIGTANANRDRWELKDLIGFFVNLQCLRINMEQGSSFKELVQHVQETATESFDNQDVPFERIVSQLKRQRDLSRHPLVQVTFSLHSQGTLGTLELGEALESELVDPPPTTRFDLEFHIADEGNSWRANMIYSKDLYEPQTINSIASVFNTLLDQALKEPDTPIASLPLLTDVDRGNLDSMGLINIDTTDYPRNSSVVDLFKEQVSLHPNHLAVKDKTEQYTYAELDEKSDILCHWLLQHKPSFSLESMIAVMASRSCETIIAFIGILKAGMAYIPLNHNTPEGRVETILSTIKTQKRLLLLGHGVNEPAIGLHDAEMVRISTVLEAKMPTSSPMLSVVSATSLASVLFTSGSTGQPKGVMIEHSGISRLIKDSKAMCHLPSSGAVAHFLNLSFDASTLEIYSAILNGLTLVCIDEMTTLDGFKLQMVFEQDDIRTAVFTPALLNQILRENPEALGTLEMLCVGGDRFQPGDCIKAHKFTAKGAKVINMYGPTENTVLSTAFCYEEGEESFANGSVPIGRAIANSGALIMDPKQRLVPPGVQEDTRTLYER